MLTTNTHILYHEFEYLEPATVAEAAALLAEHGDRARVMAGGTDLLVQLKMERRQPPYIVSLKRIAALQGIARNGSVTIGAATSLRAISKSPLATLYPALAEACNCFSTVQIMYMATIGGNLCNASPAADSAPCLLVLDASAAVESQRGQHTLPLADFFLAPGKTVLQPDELLVHVTLPPSPAHTGSAFLKVSRVTADISQVCAAVRVTRDGDRVQEARIALGSVAPTPVRALQAEQSLGGERFTPELAEHAAAIAAREIRPIDDVRATRAYRQHAARVIVRDALKTAWERSRASE